MILSIPSFVVACLPATTVQVDATVTAYTPSLLGGGAGTGLTSIGLHTRRHPYGIAADARLLPPGTWVRVPGYRDGAWLQVDDTGAAMRHAADRGDLHIDLRYRDDELPTVRQWGRRRMPIEVWVPDPPAEVSADAAVADGSGQSRAGAMAGAERQ